MGAHGSQSDQRRRRRAAGGIEPSACGALVYRFSAQPRRSKDFRRKVSLRHFDEKLRFQTLVSGKRHDHRAVRKSRRTLEEASQGFGSALSRRLQSR